MMDLEILDLRIWERFKPTPERQGFQAEILCVLFSGHPQLLKRMGVKLQTGHPA